MQEVIKNSHECKSGPLLKNVELLPKAADNHDNFGKLVIYLEEPTYID